MAANLNSSPRCNLTSPAGPLPWAESVKARYNKTAARLPNYISRLRSAEREVAATALTALQLYNAYEEDIAELHIYFGKSTALGNYLRNWMSLVKGFI